MGDQLAVQLQRAGNPGPFSLEGTNTYVVSEPRGSWVIDPGPALDDHLDAVAARVAGSSGPWRGILLTHDHDDHAEGIPGLLARTGPAPVAAARGAVDVVLADGMAHGPFTVLGTPGHATDHLAFLADGLLFSGDAVLGRGSVFVAPSPGALRGYLTALERLRALAPRTILPGHGPRVDDPDAKLAEYLEHRRAREEALLETLRRGGRSVDELLDGAWSDVPEHLRPAAAVTLAAHLDKLAEDDALPAGVERPQIPASLTA